MYGGGKYCALYYYFLSKTQMQIFCIYRPEECIDKAQGRTILSELCKQSVKGKLLSWIKQYQDAKKLKYSFKVPFPQGSKLSPMLFNVLMDSVLIIIIFFFLYLLHLQLTTDRFCAHVKQDAVCWTRLFSASVKICGTYRVCWWYSVTSAIINGNERNTCKNCKIVRMMGL